MADDELKALVEQIDARLENANGYLDQVAAYTASVMEAIQITNSRLDTLISEIRSLER